MNKSRSIDAGEDSNGKCTELITYDERNLSEFMQGIRAIDIGMIALNPLARPGEEVESALCAMMAEGLRWLRGPSESCGDKT